MDKMQYVFLVFFFVFSFLIFNHSLTQAKWQIEILDQDNTGQYTSIAIDKDNYPHISYCDLSVKNDLNYIGWNGDIWDKKVVDTAEGTSLSDISMAIDTNNCSHISYFENYPSFSLKHAKYAKDDKLWIIDEIERLSNPGFNGISLAIDGNNYPHISYVERIPGDPFNLKLKYTWWDGDSWVGKGTIDDVYCTAEGVSIADTSLALDTNYDAHISYYYNDGISYGLKYVKGDGSTWSTPGFVDQAGNVGKYSSLKLDSSGNIYISYYDIENKTLKYATKKVGLAWSTSTIDSQDNVGQYTSLQIDSNDNPHISYYDASNGYLKYAHKNGSSPWAIEIVDAEAKVGQYSSLALDENDRPHISYYDETNNDLKYAKWIPTYFIKGYVKNSEGAGLEGITLILSGDTSMTYTTTDTGYYEFLDLVAGNYTLTATKSDGSILFEEEKTFILENNLENQNFIGVEIVGIKRKMEIHNYPNPCHRGKGTTFVYTVDKANNVSLNIYTDVGEFVRGVVDVYTAPGTYEAEWNGKDIHGNQMEPGLYFVVLEVGKKVKKNALIILP